MYLLDVNVLIALLDPFHEHHQKVTDWYLTHQRSGWATCPLTENGFIRIFGHRNYPEGPRSTLIARSLLRRLCLQPGHLFWMDAISLRDAKCYDRLPVSKQLTDYYLLALANANQGSLATLDQRIDPSLLQDGEASYCVI